MSSPQVQNSKERKRIRVAIVGVGNCCSSLYQGIHYYDKEDVATTEIEGIMRPNIGGYKPSDIEVVAAFDVDKRKVGLPIGKAIFSDPNCTPVYQAKVAPGPTVQMGVLLDGVADHMKDYPDEQAFRVSEEKAVDVVEVLKKTQAAVLINYLPVGSKKATEFYAQCCIDAKVAMLNCIPVFIASNPKWEQKFIDAGLPIIGDDMKSQFGASVLSQVLQETAISRGCRVKAHIQRNVGGNTDFLNMMDQKRLKSKKISKENVIRAPFELNKIDQTNSFFHAGPSEYIRYYKDNKVANLRVEMEGFMGAPITMDIRLSVIDSPNSAGIVIDAARYLKVAREMGIVGALKGPSAFTQKSPPYNLSLADSIKECDLMAERKYSEITKKQKKQ